MLIDWFTLGAQALNFLVLVWLLKRFLYHPILLAIDTREQRIAAELADAAAKKADARKESDEFANKNAEFDRQRADLFLRAAEEVKAERQRLFEEVRQAADALETKRREMLQNDARSLNAAIRVRTQKEVFAIARKVLGDLAATSLEERMGEVFTRRLRELDGAAKASLAAAIKNAPAPALLRTTFELPAEQCAVIQHALNETFSAEVQVRFETSPDLVSGIELTISGQKLAWSIAEYFVSLEKGIGELLNHETPPPHANSPVLALS